MEHNQLNESLARDAEKSLQKRKITRRKLLKFGLLGSVLTFTGLAVSPIGKVVYNRMSEEIAHATTATLYHPNITQWSEDQLTICWLGHASFLINFYGTRILIDPALELRIGVTPIGDYTIGPKRYVEPALLAEEVGPVDLLIVSHAHTDHFDYPTLRKIQSPNTVAVTAKNTTPLWEGLNYKELKEIHWGDEFEVTGVKLKALEGKHWGARLPWYKGMEANSYLISKNGVNIFYAGDTGYTHKFKEQLQGTPINIAIFGISAYSPKSFEAKHCTPEQAWKMAQEIGAQWVIPMHWGTFKLSQEPMDEPMRRFMVAVGEEVGRVPIRDIGSTWTYTASEKQHLASLQTITKSSK